MSAETRPPADLDAFDAEIVRLAEAKFAKNEPALINALGVELGSKLAEVKLDTGKTFVRYLQDRFADRFEIINVKPNTPGLWPKGRAYEKTSATLAQRPGRQRTKRYHRWFWNAFAEPLPSGRRFFDPKQPRIVDAETSDNPAWIEVPGHLIRKGDEPRNVREIHQHIDEWLRQTGQPVEQFVDEEAELPVASAHRTVLDALLESLTARQLQSVTMPLDVIAELAKRRV